MGVAAGTGAAICKKSAGGVSAGASVSKTDTSWESVSNSGELVAELASSASG